VFSAAHAFKKILSESGIRGLWKGSIPNVQRAALVNLGDLTTYDTAKQLIMHKTGLPDSHLLHCLSRYIYIAFYQLTLFMNILIIFLVYVLD
jgi:solute carrier family 25 uncoupling protein 27